MLLHDALGRAERRGERIKTIEARLADLASLDDARRTTIASLDIRATSDDLRLKAALAHAATLASELATARIAMDEARSAHDIARTQSVLAAQAREALTARVEALSTALARLETERDALSTETARSEQRQRLQAATIDGLTDRVTAQDAEHDTLHRLLDEAQARRDALSVERTRLLGARAADAANAPAAAAAAADDPAPGAPEDRAARLRAAIVSLAADLVAFATAPAAHEAG